MEDVWKFVIKFDVNFLFLNVCNMFLIGTTGSACYNSKICIAAYKLLYRMIIIQQGSNIPFSLFSTPIFYPDHT